jgi:hypothetical protein
MLGIENLSRTEKLRMMELLWDDLARGTPMLASPDWHGDELKKTELAHASGEAGFVDWEEAKKMMRDSKA